jgi:secreted trypsin-like serine protease
MQKTNFFLFGIIFSVLTFLSGIIVLIFIFNIFFNNNDNYKHYSNNFNLSSFSNKKDWFGQNFLNRLSNDKNEKSFQSEIYEKCNESYPKQILTTRIIGGSRVTPHSYPWIVSLRLLKNRILYDHFCSGILISTFQILTAAHCVNEKAFSKDVKIIAVVGLHFRNDLSEYAIRNSYPVSKIFIHEKFNSNSSVNDIALLTLSKKVILSSNVSSICIQEESNNKNILYKKIIVAGWGVNQFLSNELQHTEMTLINNENIKCKKHLNNLNEKFVYCAAHFDAANQSNICMGDSGGPLISYDGNKWRLIGIINFV